MKRKHAQQATHQSGFTLIEAIVTVSIVALFAGFAFQMYMVAESQRISVARRAAASDIAYSNLDKITRKAQVPACTSAMDPTVTTNPPGVDLIATGAITPESNTSTLGSSVTQRLVVIYPRGCSASSMPARITSTITYGSPAESVVHVSYVN